MEGGGERAGGRKANQLRAYSCTRNPLERAHGSARWAQGDTVVLAAVYGPRPGTRKGENPEKASLEVVWKPKTGQIGRQEKEYEMTLKRTLQSICLLTVHPNTTTSIILQVMGDDGSLLPCAINASCAALVFAGIPMKHLAVAIGCGVLPDGSVILDTSKAEEQQLKSFAHLVFPNSSKSVDVKEPQQKDGQSERGLITSITHGVMSQDDYFNCIERGLAASARISDFMRTTLQKHTPEYL
ncbi:exosome complex exonuclease RRP46 homolog [Hordeum vulgare subsp. vulgare]|uniref:Exosome complex exonuclease RRP46 homolog n=1 Tax=Hordeum vulgare subsp. vulgare TaxID=112509 RepID=A0A8I7BG06_HORVV|nr:exosome complex exonuclease RRP46 homolog [Hordeum vulgare subsp. vulgare]